MHSNDTLITPAQLHERLGDPSLLLVDLTTARSYTRHHVAGAAFVSYDTLVRGGKPASGLLPDAAHIHRLLSSLGVSPQRHVVAYDDEGGGKACRLLWTLDVFGHDAWSLLDGGIQAWVNEGRATSSETAVLHPSRFENPARDDGVADFQYVLDNLDNPAVALLDARTPEEYSGARVRALRGGHIPGAVNLNWLDTLDRERGLRLRPDAELRTLLEAHDVTPDKEVIPYCQTHHRSAHSFFVLRRLGYPKVRPYAGSWSEWGNHPEAPVET